MVNVCGQILASINLWKPKNLIPFRSLHMNISKPCFRPRNYFGLFSYRKCHSFCCFHSKTILYERKLVVGPKGGLLSAKNLRKLKRLDFDMPRSSRERISIACCCFGYCSLSIWVPFFVHASCKFWQDKAEWSVLWRKGWLNGWGWEGGRRKGGMDKCHCHYVWNP